MAEKTQSRMQLHSVPTATDTHITEKARIMNTPDSTHISKLLSPVLRHNPQKIDLELDQNGWVDTKP